MPSPYSRLQFRLPGPPTSADFEREEDALVGLLREWCDYYEDEQRTFRCGKCGGRFAEGQLEFGAPSIAIDGCSHRHDRLDPAGKRRKAPVRGLTVPGREANLRGDPLKHPRAGRWYWESTQHYMDKERYGLKSGERQYTFECKCGLQRVVKNHRLVRAFCEALVSGREIVIGVDV